MGPGTATDGGNTRSAADPLAISDIETCMDVLEAMLADDKSRVAWLIGFLVGSSLEREGAPS